MGGQDPEKVEDRSLQRDLQSENIQAAFDKLLKEQAFQEKMQGQQFLQSKDILGLQQGFQSDEAEKAYQRALDTLLKEQAFASGESALGREFTSSEAQKARDFEKNSIEEAIARGQALMQQGESQLMSVYDTPLQELQQMKRDIAEGNTEAQQQQRRQTNLSLAQQGVRGGQAATLSNRASGELSKNLNRDLNQLTLDEAQRRRDAKANYLTNKATTGATSYVR